MTTIDNDLTQVLSSAQTEVMGETKLAGAAGSPKIYTTNNRLKPCNIIINADCSSSVWSSIDSINDGLAGVKKAICKDPVSAKAAHVAVVAFSSEVKVLPLADAGDIVTLDESESASAERAFVPAELMPEVRLRAKGATHLNESVLAALKLEREQVNRQAREGYTPHRSVLVILSDGADYPGGSVEEAAEAINAAKREYGLKVLFCAYGDCPVGVSELLAPDGFFQVEPGEPIDDFLDLVGKFACVFSSDRPGAAPNVLTNVDAPDSPVHFISPRGMSFREFLAA